LRGTTSQIEVGSQDNYQARCREHFQPKVEQSQNVDILQNSYNKLEFELQD